MGKKKVCVAFPVYQERIRLAWLTFLARMWRLDVPPMEQIAGRDLDALGRAAHTPHTLQGVWPTRLVLGRAVEHNGD